MGDMDGFLAADARVRLLAQMGFFLTRPDEKIPLACFVLRELLPRDQQTIVFVATRHHVELLSNRFAQEGLACVPIYGSMDLIARRTNLSKFRNKKAMSVRSRARPPSPPAHRRRLARHSRVLIVTDVAARGIDVPLLDNVLNFDFPATPKLFVHRVGRAARAGRSGLALSLVTNEEVRRAVQSPPTLGSAAAVTLATPCPRSFPSWSTSTCS